MIAIEANELHHRFGDRHVLRNISLKVRAGEWVAVTGPSGCGKSTLLSLLAGHLRPWKGRVIRRVSMQSIPQHCSLFPWLTVRQNVALALRDLQDPRAREHRIESILQQVNLSAFASEYPHRLSGGMRQRGQLARALVRQAQLLILDEPFSALDRLARRHMGELLMQWMNSGERAIVMVTHDEEDADRLAHRAIKLETLHAHHPTMAADSRFGSVRKLFRFGMTKAEVAQ